jgi:hypothetical protein
LPFESDGGVVRLVILENVALVIVNVVKEILFAGQPQASVVSAGSQQQAPPNVSLSLGSDPGANASQSAGQQGPASSAAQAAANIQQTVSQIFGGLSADPQGGNVSILCIVVPDWRIQKVNGKELSDVSVM